MKNIILSAIVLLVLTVFVTPAFAGYEEIGTATFEAHGAWQNVTITTQPNIYTDPDGVSITGYAIFEETGTLELEVCEGNTYNANAVFKIIPPGLPRITNVHNPKVHQEGLNIRVSNGTATDVTVETWRQFY